MNPWQTNHHSFNLHAGVFARKSDAEAVAVQIHNALRRFYTGVSPAVTRIDGKKGAYSVMLPRIHTQWWPRGHEYNDIMYELYRVTQEFSDIYDRNNV